MRIKIKAPELRNERENNLVDEEEVYRNFGGYLPAEVMTAEKLQRKQRGDSLHNR